MKRILLLAATLGLMGVGMGSAMSREVAPRDQFGGCRWYCDSTGTGYLTSGDCAKACGGSSHCEPIC